MSDAKLVLPCKVRPYTDYVTFRTHHSVTSTGKDLNIDMKDTLSDQHCQIQLVDSQAKQLLGYLLKHFHGGSQDE